MLLLLLLLVSLVPTLLRTPRIAFKCPLLQRPGPSSPLYFVDAPIRRTVLLRSR
uniref:Secreted protein n=1 Tax=Anopheles quadriannulatus TaxID=34691 RepID=A0A182XQ85_ANOQN